MTYLRSGKTPSLPNGPYTYSNNNNQNINVWLLIVTHFYDFILLAQADVAFCQYFFDSDSVGIFNSEHWYKSTFLTKSQRVDCFSVISES